MSTTSCARCGAQHDPGASPCPELSLVGRTLHAGIRVRERLEDTPLGHLYRAEYPNGREVAVVLLGSTSRLWCDSLFSSNNVVTRCESSIRMWLRFMR